MKPDPKKATVQSKKAPTEAKKASTKAPPSRREPVRRRALLLEQIIDAAAVVFAERGVTSTSLQDVADHLGVSRAALYYHVKSRDHLLRLVIGSYISVRRQWLHDLRERADMTPEERLREAVRGLTRGFHTQPHYSRIFLRAEMEFPEDVRVEQRKSRRAIHGEVELILADGVRAGVFSEIDTNLVTFAIFGMINWMHAWYTPGGRLHAEEVADAFSDLLLRGIRRDPADGDVGTAASSISQMRALLDQLEGQVSGAEVARRPARNRVQRGA